MRLIEEQMIDALHSGEDWKKGNTEVAFSNEYDAKVYLHGNHIANVGKDFLELHDGGWRSNTTKSRLNALLEGLRYRARVRQQDFEGKDVTDDRTDDFFNGVAFF